MKTNLSVNVNKIALLRNSRGGSIPNVVQFAKDAERFGADGITVHPRPDQRHIRFQDVYDLSKVVQTEFNVEGYPTEHFMEMVLEVKPHQVTLVPDPPEALTSSQGWDTVSNKDFLESVIQRLSATGIRVSLFVETRREMIKGALDCGADRIELYTGPFAEDFIDSKENAVKLYADAAKYANEIGVGINAGHDLNLENLGFFKQQVPELLEVSIGHALVRDCLYFGLENTIALYQRLLD